MIVRCATCGKEFEKKGARTQRKFCSRLCRSRMMNAKEWGRDPNPPDSAPRFCPCGTEFIPVRVTQKWCSGPCRNRMTVRKRKHGVAPSLLWLRSGGTCVVCLGPVDRALRYPHPGCLTVEHIVPLAAGGDGSETNLAISHFACNRQKGTTLLANMSDRPFLRVFA